MSTLAERADELYRQLVDVYKEHVRETCYIIDDELHFPALRSMDDEYRGTINWYKSGRSYIDFGENNWPPTHMMDATGELCKEGYFDDQASIEEMERRGEE